MFELKPCPFCGGEAMTFDYEAEHDIYDSTTLGYVDTEHYTVYGCCCPVCRCSIERESKEEAEDLWNTRSERS